MQVGTPNIHVFIKPASSECAMGIPHENESPFRQGRIPLRVPKPFYANWATIWWQAVHLIAIIAQMAVFMGYSDDDLLAYLDEMLPPERMAAIEAHLRTDEPLRLRVAALSRRRDEGIHSVGEIWRRSRLSCPSRSQLGSFLLGTLSGLQAQYVEFHLRSIGCRLCTANLHDLERSLKPAPEANDRRRRFFESSAGRLRDLSSGRRR